jgi:hypothetical protein
LIGGLIVSWGPVEGEDEGDDDEDVVVFGAETACVAEDGTGGVLTVVGGTISSGATFEPGLVLVGVSIDWRA